MTRLKEVLEGFMEERGIKDADELASAMRAVEPHWPFTGAALRAVADDPVSLDAVLVTILGDVLGSDEEEGKKRAKALLDAATEDVRPIVRARAREYRARQSSDE